MPRSEPNRDDDGSVETWQSLPWVMISRRRNNQTIKCDDPRSTTIFGWHVSCLGAALADWRGVNLGVPDASAPANGPWHHGPSRWLHPVRPQQSEMPTAFWGTACRPLRGLSFYLSARSRGSRPELMLFRLLRRLVRAYVVENRCVVHVSDQTVIVCARRATTLPCRTIWYLIVPPLRGDVRVVRPSVRRNLQPRANKFAHATRSVLF